MGSIRKMNSDVRRQQSIQELFLEVAKKFADDVLIICASFNHMKTMLLLYSILEDEIEITPKIRYYKRIVEMFIYNIHSLHQTRTIPLHHMKDFTFPFLLGQMLNNHQFNCKSSRVLRSRAFYMIAYVGDVLDLKVDKITESNYELLVLHKHSQKFKLDDLNLSAILPKTGTTIALAKDDCIRAAVIDYDRQTQKLIVGLDENVVDDLNDIKLGKLKPTDAACSKVSTNQLCFSNYLKTKSPILFNKSEWQEEMEEFGIDPFITGETNEQPKRSNQLPRKIVHDIVKKLKVNPSDEPSKIRAMNALLKSAKKFDEHGTIDKAIDCLKAAKLLFKDKHSFSLAIRNKKFSKRLVKAWSKL